MRIKEILANQIFLIRPEEKELNKIAKETEKFVEQLEKKLKKNKIKADVFIGGSLAKDTIIKKDKYDIDLFVRFDKDYKDEELSSILGKILKKAKRIHGSRDYFQLRKGKVIFEIIPTIKIAKPEQARNVTDLSYFHVSYIKGKINKNKKLADEIRLAKSFCFSQECYGAESYIGGFSGYSLELLVSYYKSFLNFIKNIKDKQKIIIDPSKFYRNKQEILLELNEAKLQSPIIFIDPTFKERNALAALSKETFEKFKKSCKEFLAKPSEKFFEKKDAEQKLRKKYKNLTIIEAKTNKQKGDIAGSKLKKFYDFFTEKINKYFEINKKEFFYYENRNTAKFYFVLKLKKEIIIEGPPITKLEHLINFKKAHKKCFIKKEKVYAKEKGKNIKELVKEIRKDKVMKEMGITKVELVK